MSLYEVADGILETHVTWKDVEETLQKSLGTRANFGKLKKATNISDMKGFLSIIALIEPDWIGDEENLPQKFIVKISSQLAMLSFSRKMNNATFGEEKLRALSNMSRKFHNREVEVYKLLQRFNNPNIPYTKVYALKSFDSSDDLKGFIIAEYISNVKEIGMHDDISPEELTPVVRGIASFSAICEKLSNTEKQFAMGEEYLELLFRQFFNANDMDQKFQLLRGALEEQFPKQVDRLIEIYRCYLRIVPNYSKLSERFGFKRVLNHGDLWQANILFTEHKATIIDWQICANLSPGLDTSRLLVACLSTEDRRNHGAQLLRLYYETFSEALGEELFPFEELETSFDLYFPPMVMLIQTRLLPFLNLAEPENPKIKEKVMGKVAGLMEDVFEVHERNLNKFPDFFL